MNRHTLNGKQDQDWKDEVEFALSSAVDGVITVGIIEGGVDIYNISSGDIQHITTIEATEAAYSTFWNFAANHAEGVFAIVTQNT